MTLEEVILILEETLVVVLGMTQTEIQKETLVVVIIINIITMGAEVIIIITTNANTNIITTTTIMAASAPANITDIIIKLLGMLLTRL